MSEDSFYSRSTWDGLVTRAAPTAVVAEVIAPIKRAKSSGAGAFLALASDNRRYWVKVPGNPQGDQVLVNEVIVGELGRILDAPICQRVLLRVSPAIARGWKEFPVKVPDADLIAHGSLAIESAIDDDLLSYTRRGANPVRQARILGLWDLCLGEDEQWIYEAAVEMRLWSYDHGFWFTTGQGDWDPALLSRLVGLDGSWRNPPNGLDPDALEAMADRVEGLTSGELLSVVSAVPLEWEPLDENLEAMAWFLFSRRAAVATRLRALAIRQGHGIGEGAL